jgi:riboflavin-specific deaminase-like protein
MQVLRKKSDAILMGASTLRSFRGPLRAKGARVHPLNVVVSSTLRGVSPSWPFFRMADQKPLLFVSHRTSLARRKAFAPFAEIIILNAKSSAASQIVAELESRRLRRLLVEGGGAVMWDFVAAGLLDELHVTLTPWILGGTESPTLVDGKGFPAGKGQKLRLTKLKRLGHELFLTYRKA